MQLTQSILVCAIFFYHVLAIPTKPQQCNSWPAQELYGWAPALEYCSSSYPPTPVTTTYTDYYTITVEGKPTTYVTTKPHVLPAWTKTTSTRWLVTATATTTDWNAPVSTWYDFSRHMHLIVANVLQYFLVYQTIRILATPLG